MNMCRTKVFAPLLFSEQFQHVPKVTQDDLIDYGARYGNIKTTLFGTDMKEGDQVFCVVIFRKLNYTQRKELPLPAEASMESMTLVADDFSKLSEQYDFMKHVPGQRGKIPMIVDKNERNVLKDEEVFMSSM